MLNSLKSDSDLKVGTRVKVIKSNRKKSYHKTLYEIGTVERCGGENAVLLDRMRNVHSSNGWFWYKESEIEILKDESEEEGMSKLTGYNKVAVIDYGLDHKYYFALYDDDVKAGDLVYTNNTGEKVLTVESVISADEAARRSSVEITKEVICKIDISAFNERKAKREAKRDLQKRMDLMIRQMDDTIKYKIYAVNNPALAELLSEYQAL